MRKILVTKSLLQYLPNYTVIALQMNVKVESSAIIEKEIQKYEQDIQNKYNLEDVLLLPYIKEGRDGYKKLGKDPSRYRLACESLLRRLVKGNGLYRINNVVDAGNILSIELCRSIAVLDNQKIVGDIIYRLGTKDDDYYGIGRGKINIENIPVYVDDISPFGSTTSDTERTQITNDTKEILLLINCFQNTNILENKNKAIEIFKKYAYANNIMEIPVVYDK